jgi:hypothetical protein
LSRALVVICKPYHAIVAAASQQLRFERLFQMLRCQRAHTVHR